MQLLLSPFKSASSRVAQNRCSSSDVNTTATQVSFLEGSLKHDRVDISPRFAGRNYTYLEFGETHMGKTLYYQYENCVFTGKEGVFIKDANDKPLFVQIVKKDADKTASSSKAKDKTHK